MSLSDGQDYEERNPKAPPIHSDPAGEELICNRCGKPAREGVVEGGHCGQFFDPVKKGMFCSGRIVKQIKSILNNPAEIHQRKLLRELEAELPPSSQQDRSVSQPGKEDEYNPKAGQYGNRNISSQPSQPGGGWSDTQLKDFGEYCDSHEGSMENLFKQWKNK